MFTFAKFAQIIISATKQNNEDVVNNLLGCIIKPLNLRNKNGEEFYFDKSYCSYLLSGKRDIVMEVQRGAGTQTVINNAEKYYTDYIVPKIIPFLIPDLINNIKVNINNDVTISETTKAILLSLAKKETLAKFLASVCLYVITKPNKETLVPLVINNLPEQNQYFSGRVGQLESIDQVLRNKKNEVISICQTVSGLGGIGKTQLAIEYAYRYGYKYRNCIWFINAENATTIYNDFCDFANRFNLVLPEDFKLEDLQDAVREWLFDNKDWLFIFDNLEIFDDIKDYLPSKIYGRIIITTRNKRITFGYPLELNVFEENEAISFFKKRFSYDESLKMEYYSFNDFEVVAVKLVERLGYLPLALEQAAAYIKEVKCSITQYIELLNESGTDAFSDEYATPQYYESIVTLTWNISFNALEESSKQLMNLCAYMAPDKIPVGFFVDMRDKLPMPLKKDLSKIIDTNRIVTALRIYSLATGNSEFINIHRLVQEVVRKSHNAEMN